MRCSQVSLALTYVALASACQRDFFVEKRHTHRKPITKRADDVWPPVLTEEETILVNAFDNVTVDEWSDYYGHQVKLAGLGKEAAQWTADRWTENGFNAQLKEYHVYLSYPVHASLDITYPNGTTNNVRLDEDVLEEDDVTGREDRQPTFHGYSASGNVTGEYVYVGRGSQADFDRLVELGVDLKGKIALARYGGLFRGLKVKNAQDHGMIGAVIFTDPGDDGNQTVANGYEAYPHGPARNPSAVQKGSVLFLSTHPGDPTTPGYPSHEGVDRADISPVTPKIPSIPISYASAEPLLQALDGFGVSAEEVNRTIWAGALNANYSSGPAPGVTLHLDNLMEGKITPIWNVIGQINGTNADETIVIGNHRDTWMIGGNGDPNSGSAILVEFTKAVNVLVSKGWKPKRNIVIASWDAEEYGLVGSTEWVEDHVDWLTETAVAYLNIDVAVSGPRPALATTPELQTVGTEIFKKIIYPNFGGFNISLYDAWLESSEGIVESLGSGSDFTGFLHRGINSLDVGSNNGATDPIWHYHSNYDTYHWMANFGDPGFLVHAAIGQYLTLLAYHLADDEVLPIDVPNYATELRAYLSDLEEYAESEGAEIDLSELSEAIEVFATRAHEVKALEQLAVTTGDADLITVVNHKYRDFQRGFISQGGLPDREFYKHVITAPGLDTGYAAVLFPGITEGIQYGKGNLTVAEEWVSKTARGILRAANIIKT
ncbi:PA domain-containing protein [Colletotrichum scovillei]|uniref:PA domain-containing protein n=1 Tax=Colletotrichum scovillei TaxID=1209932 RepID=A0A9P7UEH9_9PEZI|nr:PA domain-containing protein [Colletotrichum scovillei]KAF4776822.1 PA domain-containing protein [Colletotrichum scovillei]KAG7053678.1 PA domain-containing protein [Colletotrichum scovillei]KAG7071972.1 PA domain-containing protein [Colletotrichum scovillei]KAG7080316.1 PA domain-containing protein [Colletotrichum scovillei]